MPKEFDKYLSSLSDQDKQNLKAAQEDIQEAKSANAQTVQKDYLEREGRPLDTSVSGYNQQLGEQPLNKNVRKQVDHHLLDRYLNNELPIKQNKEYQQDIDRWEDDGGR
jgi:hypothetical protein